MWLRRWSKAQSSEQMRKLKSKAECELHPFRLILVVEKVRTPLATRTAKMNHWNDGFAADASLCRMRLGHSCHVPRMRNHWKIKSKTKLDHACMNDQFRQGFARLCTCRKSARCQCNSSNQSTFYSWPRTADCDKYNCEENTFPGRRSFLLDLEFWADMWDELHIAIK